MNSIIPRTLLCLCLWLCQWNYVTSSCVVPSEKVLCDFTNNAPTDDWCEVSDTKGKGMSKAVFVTQITKSYRRAVFFSLLNPQPCGSAFAGVRKIGRCDLSQYNHIKLRVRAQGQNQYYKVVLRHRDQNDDCHATYEYIFSVNLNELVEVSLPLCEFKPYLHGKPNPQAGPLDKSFVSSLGFQMFAGMGTCHKQCGASSLEVLWIKASK